MASLDDIKNDLLAAKSEVKAKIEEIRGILDSDSPEPPTAIVPQLQHVLGLKVNELTKIENKLTAIDSHISNPT